MIQIQLQLAKVLAETKVYDDFNALREFYSDKARADLKVITG